MGEIIFLAFFIVLCGLGFGESFTWKIVEGDTSGGAAFWPRMIMAALVICCIIRIIQILRDQAAKEKKFVFLDLFYSHRGAFLLALVLYAAGIQFLGFLIATVLFLNIIVNLMYYFAQGNLGKPVSIAVRTVCLCAAAYGVYYFFGSILRIMVPTGIFGI